MRDVSATVAREISLVANVPIVAGRRTTVPGMGERTRNVPARSDSVAPAIRSPTSIERCSASAVSSSSRARSTWRADAILGSLSSS